LITIIRKMLLAISLLIKKENADPYLTQNLMILQQNPMSLTQNLSSVIREDFLT